MVALLYERQNPQSYWKPYLDIIPDEFPTIPLFWSDDELDLLRGTYAFGLCCSVPNRTLGCNPCADKVMKTMSDAKAIGRLFNRLSAVRHLASRFEMSAAHLLNRNTRAFFPRSCTQSAT